MITRREFMKIGATSAAGIVLFGGSPSAFADESSRFVEFTPEIAENIADSFANSAFSNESLVVSPVTPLRDNHKRLLGYIAAFEKNDVPHGCMTITLRTEDTLHGHSDVMKFPAIIARHATYPPTRTFYNKRSCE